MNYRKLDRKCGLEKFDNLDVLDAVSRAQADMATQRHDSREPGKVRGGSVGALIGRDVHGVCHRKAYARFNGIETPLPEEIELMTKQGEQNEEIWLTELREFYKDTDIKVMDQDSVECTWTLPDGTPGSGSVDITLWRDNKPLLLIENKNCSSVTTAKSVHYELRPKEDHVIQAANYALRLGDQYCDREPVPAKIIYSSRIIYHFFAMPANAKKAILGGGHDIGWSFGKPSTLQPFHREYLIDWDIDGYVRYWTAGLKDWVKTKIDRKSIDDYYVAVSSKIDERGHLGPRPSTKHIDGKSSYSPCNYCEFKSVCDLGESITPQEFKDRAQLVADEAWKERLGK